MEKNQKEILDKLYSVRSVLIQINYHASDYFAFDLMRYSEHGVHELNSLIERISQCEASNERWLGLSEKYQLKTKK